MTAILPNYRKLRELLIVCRMLEIEANMRHGQAKYDRRREADQYYAKALRIAGRISTAAYMGFLSQSY